MPRVASCLQRTFSRLTSQSMLEVGDLRFKGIMDVNKTEQELSGDEILLEEPHFDEESTILSARPVVPLEVVEAKSRSLRRILIGAALVVALMVGAFAASFIFRLRSAQPASDVVMTEDSPAQSQVVLESGVVALEPPDPEPVVEAEEPEPVSSEKQRDETAVVKPAVVKNVPAKSAPPISRQPSPRVQRTGIRSRRDEPIKEELASQRELNQEIRRAERREERRQERREERRARRVEEAKHQGMDRDSRSTDDLLRIREIFEGRPRP